MHPYRVYVVSVEAIERRSNPVLSIKRFHKLQRNMEVQVNFYIETDPHRAEYTGILQVIIPPYPQQLPGGKETTVVEGEMLECSELCGIVKLVLYPQYQRMLLLPQ